MPEESKRLRPSFPAEVNIVDSPGQSDVLFEAVAETPASAVEVMRAAEAFETAARAGMFSRDPAAQRIPIEAVSAERPSERRVRYEWRVVGIQPGAFRVLLNMLEVVHRFFGPLESVHLSSTIGHGERMNLDGVLKAPFPGTMARPPFSVVLKPNLEDSKEPLIRLEFQREVHDGEIETLLPLFVAWDNIIIRGGYLNDVEDRYSDVDVEESLSGQQTYLAAPNTVEHLFYEFIGAAAAYDALVNMAVRIHHTLRPLATFEIE